MNCLSSWIGCEQILYLQVIYDLDLSKNGIKYNIWNKGK